ncbi:MAG: cysteine--tRNA ligase [Proteobacteria bacterium]|nr:cysteine--tRNA ligase [Pseudomonadota bacterium]
MQKISITNTMTGKKEPLVLNDPSSNHIGIYACGVTVYDDCHIGHAMQAIYFDVIRNFFEYVGYKVTYVRNYTDVDDKIIARAKERGISPLQLSASVIESSIRDMKAIGVRPATFEPKVSESISDIISMTQKIIENGMAYATASGDVYFRVRKKQDYGKLSNRKPDDMRSGTRDIVVGEKEYELDFALWKADSTADGSWPSPWGQGRPGWHIECSAMALKTLGASFEIHGGGRDLVFPHHENEIAQSEAANCCGYAKYWIHSGLLTIDHQKMSKSLGNHITIQKFLEKWPPEVLRLGFLTNHYQSNIDFSLQVFQTCLKRLLYYYETLNSLDQFAEQFAHDLKGGLTKEQKSKEPAKSVIDAFVSAMSDDFNSAKALGEMNKSFKTAKDLVAGKKSSQKQQDAAYLSAALKEIGSVLGLFRGDVQQEILRLKRQVLPDLGVTENEIEQAIAKRLAARASKDFATSDAVRDDMAKRGIEIRDTPQGSVWSIKFNLEE